MSLYELPPRTCEKCGAEFTRRRGEKPATFTARKRCDRCGIDNDFINRRMICARGQHND